jgi:hypothetical protein
MAGQRWLSAVARIPGPGPAAPGRTPGGRQPRLHAGLVDAREGGAPLPRVRADAEHALWGPGEGGRGAGIGKARYRGQSPAAGSFPARPPLPQPSLGPRPPAHLMVCPQVHVGAVRAPPASCVGLLKAAARARVSAARRLVYAAGRHAARRGPAGCGRPGERLARDFERFGGAPGAQGVGEGVGRCVRSQWGEVAPAVPPPSAAPLCARVARGPHHPNPHPNPPSQPLTA